MATKKKATNKIMDSSELDAFPSSPYPAAAVIEDQERERLKVERLKQLAAREQTHPHMAANIPGRPDLLAIPQAAKDALAAKGLYFSWIRKDEANDYFSRGYRVARSEDIGELRHDFQHDRSESATTVVERREMLGVICPISWEKDRLRVEGHMDARQRDADPHANVGRAVRKGHFGRGSRQPMGVFDDDDSEFLEDRPDQTR